MLRAELDHKSDHLELKLEGRLVGAWAVQVKSLVAERFIPSSLLVDLSEVSYVDSVGEQLLIWLCVLPAQFVAENNCYAREVCKQLHLTLQRSPNRSTQAASEEGLS